MFSPCTGSVGILTRGLDSEEMQREAIALSRSFPFYVTMYTYLLLFCRHCFPSLYKIGLVLSDRQHYRLGSLTQVLRQNGDWNLKSQTHILMGHREDLEHPERSLAKASSLFHFRGPWAETLPPRKPNRSKDMSIYPGSLAWLCPPQTHVLET